MIDPFIHGVDIREDRTISDRTDPITGQDNIINPVTSSLGRGPSELVCGLDNSESGRGTQIVIEQTKAARYILLLTEATISG